MASVKSGAVEFFVNFSGGFWSVCFCLLLLSEPFIAKLPSCRKRGQISAQATSQPFRILQLTLENKFSGSYLYARRVDHSH
jgi:hypothetical protein